MYTLELHRLCEDISGTREPEKAIAKSWETILGLFPIFDEEYRELLAEKILLHYYTREIGCDTPYKFILWTKAKMNEIMPYYNQMYRTELIKYDPLLTVKKKRSYDEAGTESKASEENKGWADSSEGRMSTEKAESHSSSMTGNESGNINSHTDSSGSTQEKETGGTESHETTSGTTDTSKTADGTERRSLTSETTESGTDNRTTDTTKHIDSSENTENDVTNTYGETTSGTTTGSKAFSDTPQGNLNKVEDNTYLTNYTKENGSTSGKKDTTNAEKGVLKGTGSSDATEKEVSEGKNSSTANREDSTSGTTHSSETGNEDTTGKTDGSTVSERSKNGSSESESNTIESHTGNESSETSGSLTGTSGSETTQDRTGNHTIGYGEDKTDSRHKDETLEGYEGISAQKLIMEMRESFLNIDMMVIQELEELFLQVF